MTASSQHSILAPSSAARRRQCPQSTTWEPRYPQDETPESAEGTAAHWAASEQLSGREVDIGVIAPNGVVLTQEMCEGADLYVADITTTLRQYGLTPADGHIEERVAIPRVHPDAWGTPDFWIYVPRIHAFLIWDFKYGRRYVEAVENAQLVEYAAGITQGIPENARVVFRICQPRSYHRDGPVREWSTTLLNLRASINVSANAAAEALGPAPPARVGPECRDCRARHACPSLQAAGYAAAESSRGNTPLELTPAALALEARVLTEAAALLKARIGGLEAQMQSLLKSGKSVPGWGIVRGAGRERWAKSAEEVLALGKVMGVELGKPVEAITPVQARKAGMPEAVVAALSERPPGEAKLEMIAGEAIAKIFGK